MPDKPDQADVLAQNERLTADLATARHTITTISGQVGTLTAERDSARTEVSRLNVELGTVRGQVTTLTTERDSARTDLAKAQKDGTDFEARLATELAKHGIRHGASAAGTDTAAGNPAKKKTLDEQVAEFKAKSNGSAK